MFLKINHATKEILEVLGESPKNHEGWVETSAKLPSIPDLPAGMLVKYYFAQGTISYEVSVGPGHDAIGLIAQLIDGERQKSKNEAQDELTMELIESGVL